MRQQTLMRLSAVALLIAVPALADGGYSITFPQPVTDVPPSACDRPIKLTFGVKLFQGCDDCLFEQALDTSSVGPLSELYNTISEELQYRSETFLETQLGLSENVIVDLQQTSIEGSCLVGQPTDQDQFQGSVAYHCAATCPSSDDDSSQATFIRALQQTFETRECVDTSNAADIYRRLSDSSTTSCDRDFFDSNYEECAMSFAKVTLEVLPTVLQSNFIIKKVVSSENRRVLPESWSDSATILPDATEALRKHLTTTICSSSFNWIKALQLRYELNTEKFGVLDAPYVDLAIATDYPDQLLACEAIGFGDDDEDGVLDCMDQCPGEDDSVADLDNDSVCAAVDPCFGFSSEDSDSDGFCDDVDVCPNDPTNPDADSDGACDSDGSDECVNDPFKQTAGNCGCGFVESPVCPAVGAPVLVLDGIFQLESRIVCLVDEDGSFLRVAFPDGDDSSIDEGALPAVVAEQIRLVLIGDNPAVVASVAISCVGDLEGESSGRRLATGAVDSQVRIRVTLFGLTPGQSDRFLTNPGLVFVPFLAPSSAFNVNALCLDVLVVGVTAPGCDSNCLVCSGPLPTQCLSCTTGNVLDSTGACTDCTDLPVCRDPQFKFVPPQLS